MKRHTLRNKKTGKFTTIAPIGTLAYFSRLESDGRPYCFSGWYIVTGVGKRGVVSCVPMTYSVTKSHSTTFNLMGKDKMDVTNPMILNKVSLMVMAETLMESILADENKNPAYHAVARHSASQLIIAANNLKV